VPVVWRVRKKLQKSLTYKNPSHSDPAERERNLLFVRVLPILQKQILDFARDNPVFDGNFGLTTLRHFAGFAATWWTASYMYWMNL